MLQHIASLVHNHIYSSSMSMLAVCSYLMLWVSPCQRGSHLQTMHSQRVVCWQMYLFCWMYCKCKTNAMWGTLCCLLCQMQLRATCMCQSECSAVELVKEYKGIIIPLLYLCMGEFELVSFLPQCSNNMYSAFFFSFFHAWWCHISMLI